MYLVSQVLLDIEVLLEFEEHLDSREEKVIKVLQEKMEDLELLESLVHKVHVV